MKKKKSKIDPSVRFSLLVDQEMRKKDTIVPKASYEFLEKLFAKKQELILERNVIIKGFFFASIALYLVVNNLSFAIPKAGFNVGEVPGIVEITLILSSVSFLVFALKMRDELSQASIINAYIAQNFGGRKVAQDIIKASYQAENHFINWMQFPYQIGVTDDLEYGSSGKLFLSSVMGIVGLLLLFLLLCPVLLIFYASYQYTSLNLLGKAVAGFCQLSLLTGLLVFFIGNFNFTYKN